MKNNLASEIEALKHRDQKHPSVRQGHREFRKGRYGKRIIFFHSLKNGEVLLPCEGDLEYRNCLHMEYDRSIESYWLQPFQVHIGPSKYTPDVFIQYRNGAQAFREVKPSGQLQNPEVYEKLVQANAFFINHGYSFEIVTEDKLWGGNELANLAYIYGCLSPIPSPCAKLAALEIFADLSKPVHVVDFRQLIEENNIAPNVVEFLIYSGNMIIDHDSLFSETSLLRDKR